MPADQFGNVLNRDIAVCTRRAGQMERKFFDSDWRVRKMEFGIEQLAGARNHGDQAARWRPCLLSGPDMIRLKADCSADGGRDALALQRCICLAPVHAEAGESMTQATPKRSNVMPKPCDHDCASKGMSTSPPSDNASKMRRASSTESAAMVTL